MKAVVADTYGDNSLLRVAERPDPKVGLDTVLVRTRAVGLNPVDWKILRGYLDPVFPASFPLIPCWDVAGVVEAVGPAVTEWAPGDEVVAYDREDGLGNGTLAELTGLPVRCVAPKPARASWPEAGGLPLAGLTAYQALFTHLQITAGDTVLVHAASGGVGSFAVQLARLAHARVIGSASPAKHDYLRGLGAEPVTYGEGLVDAVKQLAPGGLTAVLDLVGGVALEQSVQLLAPGARLASVAEAETVKHLGGRYVFVRPSATDLRELSRLVDAGLLRVVIARTFTMESAAEAFDLLAEGHTKGKLVIELPQTAACP